MNILPFKGGNENLTNKAELKEVVREVLAEILSNPPAQRQWYGTSDAYWRLGLDSPEQLRDFQRSGLLRLGIEVRDIRQPNAKKPIYQFHLSKCETRLLENPARRTAKKRADSQLQANHFHT